MKKIILKVLKIFIIVLLIIITLFLIHTLRNFIIIKDLQNKISKYQDNTNHHILIVSEQSDSKTKTKTNYYRKDNKKFVIMERNLNGEISKISMYDDGNEKYIFTESKANKVMTSNESIIVVQLCNGTETQSLWETLMISAAAYIRTVSENGKEYYRISNFLSPYALSFDKEAVLIDKETGLIYKNVNQNLTVTREYEFDNVEDSVFELPDISQYELK